MLYLAKSRDTFVLRCGCGHFNLSFFDRGIKLDGRVRCMVCGEEANWDELQSDLPSEHTHDDECEHQEAQIHVLHA